MIHELGGATWAELADGAAIVLVPVGSTEQHGPHLPLDTDTRVATAVAAAVAANLDLLVAPPIAYGASGEHQGFAGTVSIGTAALQAVLVEYGRSASDWARRVVFINGHGGNVDALHAAVALLRTEHRDAAWCSPAAHGSDAHAGHTETSVLLHLSPDLVRTAETRPGNTDALVDLMPRLRAGGVRVVSDSGVLGDPTTATAAHGARLFAEMVDDCADRVRRWQPRADGMLT
ncbi:mycofactocin biosynthesis peptidyl-dipeptidase MftE [Mycolicibacterium sp.]|uniref:mycofactocin biosynthesis peptidyl-dipeptidase MftE n=1 Tax=Mycolicibacterium sp. TaxID=2320850 RepID=UPI0028B24EA4|nr:mycofactocin biosynthesis peptidyl-dipeptidase MftE [Mycolicibacterium sp.]